MEELSKFVVKYKLMKNLFYELSSKELKNKSGVYLICIHNHKYVGSSKSLYARLNEHRIDLEKSQHSNSMMLNSFIKYGSTTVTYQILEYCSSEIRIFREKYWIDHIKSDMNMQDPVTKELSQISRDKISISLKKAYQSGLRKRPTGQPIEVYDIFGNFKEEYLTAEIAAVALNMNPHTIQIAASKYASGRMCGLLRFRYKYSKFQAKKFEIIDTHKLTTKFKYSIIEPDGKEVNIKLGIKNINKAILEQLLKGNYNFKFKADPK